MKSAAPRRSLRAPGLRRLTVLVLLALGAPGLHAGARTDGSAGPVQSLSGAFTVPQALGTLAGRNLFHSFQNFGIGPGESATFTTTSALRNVIARVTGGAASVLRGPLRLNAAGGGGPALFLINPAGITLGAGSAVDVPGALHLSTANTLRFADGSALRTDLAQGSSFSSAAPEAFGFLGSRTAPIRLQDQASLAITAGDALTLSAGDISLSDSTIVVAGVPVRIAAVGQAPSEVGLGGALPAATGRLVLENGALIGLVNSGARDAGGIALSAGDILLQSPASPAGAGITSIATGTGAGAAIRIDAASSLSLQQGGQIVSNSSGPGQGGAVAIHVGGKIDVGARSAIAATASSSGNAGSVSIAAGGAMALDGGGSAEGAAIGSESAGSGSSGRVRVWVAGGLSLLDGARLTSSSYGAGAAGEVTVQAASLGMDNRDAPGGTGIASNSFGAGSAGSVALTTAGPLSIVNGSKLSSSTYGDAMAGAVTVQAGRILLDNQGAIGGTGIVSETGGAGHAGRVEVRADEGIHIRDGARISSSSFMSGNAGAVSLRSASLHIEDSAPGADATGVASTARQAGSAGTIDVAVRGFLSVSDGIISTSTESSGRGGALRVSAGSMVLSNSGVGSGTAISSNSLGTGAAGSVDVSSLGALSIFNGATISSSALAQGAAGSVRVAAASLLMDGRGSAYDTSIASESYGSGSAGSIAVAVSGQLSILSQATVSSSAFAAGHAGSVRVQAESLDIDRRGGARRTGIGSVAFSGTGNGGSVDVAVAGALSLANGGEISSNTSTAGFAGSVNVSARRLTLASGASINSGATSGSSGQAGSVSVSAAEALSLADSRLSIENHASVARPEAVLPTRLSVAAPRIELLRSEITASASGNVAAGNLLVEAGRLLVARAGSSIDTSAVTGSGGAIVVKAGQALLLDQSRLTTSITGSANGDGGPITIDAPLIVLDAGFVQANTAVADARGGAVSINVDAPGALIVSRGQLVSGGKPVAYAPDGVAVNVIQAARPDGVNGALNIASPPLDLAATLALLTAPPIDFGPLGADMCRVGEGSSLTLTGRGALRPAYSEQVRPSN